MRGFLEELHWILTSDRADLVDHHLALIPLRGLKKNLEVNPHFGKVDQNADFSSVEYSQFLWADIGDGPFENFLDTPKGRYRLTAARNWVDLISLCISARLSKFVRSG